MQPPDGQEPVFLVASTIAVMPRRTASGSVVPLDVDAACDVGSADIAVAVQGLDLVADRGDHTIEADRLWQFCGSGF